MKHSENNETRNGIMEEPKQRVQNALHEVKDGAVRIAESVESNADSLLKNTGRALRTSARFIERKGTVGDMLNSSVEGTARHLDHLGEYLEGGAKKVERDFGTFVHKRPLISIAVGATLGFFVARMLRGPKS